MAARQETPLSTQTGRAAFTARHLTGISHLSTDDIETLLSRADDYAGKLEQPGFKSDILRGRAVMILFFENSTRTRISFEMAAQKLGADVITVDLESSSIKKGESLMDTVQTLDAMRPDALIVRHHEYGAPDYIAKHVRCPVLNAGDSWREHPTQALLDALTIRRAKGRIDGLTVAIVGDIAHSRVAHSNMILLRRLGANVRVIAPAALMPGKWPVDGIEQFSSLRDGLAGADIVMTLRLQKERMQAGLIESDGDYFRQYGITHDTLAYARADALVMHPGPMNRGVEISDDVADDLKRSLILEQVRLGVPVRMAALDLLLNK